MALTAVFVTLFVFHTAQAQLQWVELKPSSGPAPSIRRDSSIGYDSARNQIVIYGGRGSSIFDDTWIFDLTSKVWTKVNDTKDNNNKVIPENRFSVVYGSQGNYFYVSTGEGKVGGVRTFYNDINRFNFTSQKWEKLQPKSALSPETRYGSGGGIYPSGNGFYITHGFSGVRYSNTFKFRLDTMAWIKKYKGTTSYVPTLPHSRCLHATAMTDKDEFVLFGGCIGGNGRSGPCPANDAWKYNGDANKWTKLSECATPRTYSAMAVLPSNDPKVKRAVLYGGREGTQSYPKEEIVVFDPATNKWMKKKIAGAVPMKRYGHVMITTNNGIIVFGGRGSSGSDLNDVWLLKGNASDVDKTASFAGCDAIIATSTPPPQPTTTTTTRGHSSSISSTQTRTLIPNNSTTTASSNRSSISSTPKTLLSSDISSVNTKISPTSDSSSTSHCSFSWRLFSLLFAVWSFFLR